jgi:hypothetical protein
MKSRLVADGARRSGSPGRRTCIAGADADHAVYAELAFNGTKTSGKAFKGTFAIDRFKRATSGRYAGRMVAVGTVRGRSAGRRYVKSVVIPAT